MLRHPLFQTLFSLKGNPRACVYTEALWGIPFQLYAPYISVYMLALGMTDSQIGLLTSFSLGLQIFWALISGAVTDKLGRKKTTYWNDLLTWSVPVLIWAFAQNIWWFVAAAIVNSIWRISANSWGCLLVEDAEQDQLVHIFVWVYIAGLLAAFFSPIAGLLVHQFSLVPAVRGLYLFAFVTMTAKFVIMNQYVTETAVGQKRLEETRGVPLFSLLKGYGGVLRQVLRTRRTLIALGIMLVTGVCTMINSTFWAVNATRRLGVPEQHIAIYPFIRSSVMLIVYFLVVPRINSRSFRKPLLVGFAGLILAQSFLVFIPAIYARLSGSTSNIGGSAPLGHYVMLGISVIIEAIALTLVNPTLDSLIVTSIDPAERARINSILTVTVLALTTPFGWIAGQLSEMNRALPFVLSMSLFALGMLLVLFASRVAVRTEAVTP